jgi:hypothetical protein
MAFPKDVWNQLKATTVEEFIEALGKDGFVPDPASTGAVLAFIRPGKKESKRIVIHYHRNKTWGAKFLNGLISDVEWKLEDLIRLGLVKGRVAAPGVIPETLLVPCGCDRGVLPNGKPCPECGGTRFREIPKSLS